MEEQPAVDPRQNLDRPARKQVPGPVTTDKSSSEINIWSGRRVGPRPDGSSRADKRRQPSQYRCQPAVDTGKTRGSEGQINTFCLFFAKGMCYQGSACTYLHRLPTSADNAAMERDTGRDIFGRDKLPDNMDNRKGAGSYDRDMTTLYVNYGGAGHYATPQLRHLLLQDFGCFGPVRSIHIVPAKTIAFVRFHWRASAEFAKEAMDGKCLRESKMNEVLAVRWANDDPNPTAVINKKRQALDAVESAAMAAWEALDPEEKRTRLAVAQQARARKVSAVAAAMPEMLLQGSAGGDALQGSSSRQQFDDWRGIPGRELEPVQQTAAAQQQEQQQQQGDDGSWTDVQWAEYAAADPEAYAQWQQYYYGQQEQQQQGAWYEGWRQRHRPEAAGAAAAAAADGSATAAAGGEAVDAAGGGVLGLLAGYGSGSESGDEEAEQPTAPHHHHQQLQPAEQQQQQDAAQDTGQDTAQSAGQDPAQDAPDAVQNAEHLSLDEQQQQHAL